ncbi:MAG: MBL fold metallo-hydrolase [Acidimicrobiales bacterium]
MAWVRNHDLRVGQQLVWVFEAIRPWYPYLFPAVATIVEVEPLRKVSWEVTALPGFFARHTYTIEDLGDGRSRFSSWEQGTGPFFRATSAFWIAHFEFVKNRSLQGARLLEAAYRMSGRLDESTIPRRRGPVGTLTDLAGALEPLRLRPVRLADDVWAVLGGGGNSLVLKAGDRALVIDPKMPPFASLLRRWVEREVGVPVTTIIDTHHHFDHTFGNPRFPEAEIFAHANVPDLMRRRDRSFWQAHPQAVPVAPHLIDDTASFEFGEASVTVQPVPRAHTNGDVWVHLAKGGRDFVATGDIGCLGHYPFFDQGEGGADLVGLTRAARDIADAFPDATFVPGHGNVCTNADLRRNADYVEFLQRSVEGSANDGLDENASVRNIDVSSWRLGALPVFRYGESLVTARINVRRAYRLAVGRR